MIGYGNLVGMLVFESQTRVGNLKMLLIRTLFLSVIMLGAKIYAYSRLLLGWLSLDDVYLFILSLN